MTSEYRDFNLARIKSIKPASKALDIPKDLEWDTHVNLIIKPHPMLTPDQEILVRDELFKGAAFRSMKTRKALIGYLLRELEVAENPEKQTPPEYQLHLHSIKE
nr:hypothetical protein [Marinicella rhabdoformis]